MSLEGIGKIIVVAGGVLMLLGLSIIFSRHIPYFGKLPGDITIRRENFTFYFPIITFLILSALLTFVLNIVFRIWR